MFLAPWVRAQNARSHAVIQTGRGAGEVQFYGSSVKVHKGINRHL